LAGTILPDAKAGTLSGGGSAAALCPDHTNLSVHHPFEGGRERRGARYGADAIPTMRRAMRHLRSLLLSLVLAPLVYISAGYSAVTLGETSERGHIAVGQAALGLAAAIVAGSLYAILVMARLSPAGPALGGLMYLGVTLWALVDRQAFLDSIPANILGLKGALHAPVGAGTALLSVPLLLTILSPRRWLGTITQPQPAPPYGVAPSYPPVPPSSARVYGNPATPAPVYDVPAYYPPAYEPGGSDPAARESASYEPAGYDAAYGDAAYGSAAYGVSEPAPSESTDVLVAAPPAEPAHPQPTSPPPDSSAWPPPAQPPPGQQVPAQQVPGQQVPAQHVPAQHVPAQHVPAGPTPARPGIDGEHEGATTGT
jgi:hypothetical protein